ncbi:MAG: radical SAM protein [Bacteroidota bacterium]|nr:radical SAM protein [Bacteroidota bacterium]
MELDNIYILNPYYTLRNDRKRIILCKSPSFKVPADIAEDDIFVFIHPVFAIVLSLFNGKDRLETVLQKMSEILDSPIEDCYEFVAPFFENSKRIGMEYDGVSFELPRMILLDNSSNKFNYRTLDYRDYIIDGVLDFVTQRLFEGPTTLRILVNTVCATDCVYCYVDRRVKDNCKIPIERIKELIREAKEMKVVDFDIAGTEIFMYKYWYELVKELVDSGYYPYLSTKLPISEEVVIKLKSIGINDLQLSIDTLDEEESVIINQNKRDGYVGRMFKTLKHLEKHGINVAINTVVTKYNSSLDGIKKLLEKISQYSNIEAVTLNPAERSLGCSGKEFDAFKNPASELENIKEYIYEIESDYKFRLSFADYLDKSEFETDFTTKLEKHQSRAMCSANVSQVCILNDGQVTICEELYWNKNFLIGNVLDNSIKEIWQSDKALKLSQMDRTNFSESSNCKTCSYFDNCRLTLGVCWSNVIMAYGEEHWDFPSPNCPYSPLPYHSIHHD